MLSVLRFDEWVKLDSITKFYETKNSLDVLGTEIIFDVP